MILLGALLGAEACAVVLSVLLVRRRSALAADVRGHASRLTGSDWTVTALLAYALAADVAMLGIEACLAGAPRPFAGLARALYHLHAALFLGWPASLTAATWRTFGASTWDKATGRRLAPAGAAVVPWLVGVYLGAVVGLAALHPLGRARTAAVLHACELVAVLACVAGIVAGWRRPWGQRQIVVGLLVAIEGTLAMLGPWAHDVFRDWPRLARLPYALAFGAVVAMHAVWLRRR